MTKRQRVMSSVLAVIPGVIAIPLLMRAWAPGWAVWGWLIGYATFSVVAWILLLTTDHESQVEQWWSSAVGLWFGLLPISATIWGEGTNAYWIAASLVMVSIATEVSSLPYIKIDEWRIGVVLSGTLGIAAGYFETGPVILAAAPVLYAIISSANRMRTTKDALEQARDLADAKTAEAELLAKHDVLTGLLNRRGIAEEIERVAAGPHTMLMIDADRFKSINDGHGYAAGDQVIQSIAQVLGRRLGKPWVVGRQGGDEFVAVAEGMHELDPAVCAPIMCPVSLFGRKSSLTIGLSGGHVISPTADNPDRLLSKAGYAMRAAKRAGSPLIALDEDLSEQFDRMLEVTVPGGDEIRSSSLAAEFQVIVDNDGRIVGCEALGRWRRSDGTLVPPADFLPVLADSGRTPLLNEVMLRKGIEFAARFNDTESPIFVAVNIGSPSLSSTDLVALVSSLLDEYGVAPGRLMIEITETEGFSSATSWESAAAQLKMLGVQLAIDDFGSGYSNIERLNQLPISHLKFDRSLTTAVTGPLGEILKGVVEFAGQAGIGIIAEGIESEAELRAMRSTGVRHFQGYFFGRPDDADTVERLVRSVARVPLPSN